MFSAKALLHDFFFISKILSWLLEEAFGDLETLECAAGGGMSDGHGWVRSLGYVWQWRKAHLVRIPSRMATLIGPTRS